MKKKVINGAEDVRKRGPSCTVGGTLNWHSHYSSGTATGTVQTTLKNLKRGVCACTVQHYAVIKEEILPFAGWDES